MPYAGEVDISTILANLGDQSHGLQQAPRQLPMEERDEIYRAAYGTVDMSTSVTLKVVPRIVWDVNGYYRSLNIAFPFKPSRKALREGYQSVDGQSSERLTYYLKQLINPVVRLEYDEMALGTRYRDKYILDEEMHKLSDLASKVSEEEGKLVTVDDLMKEHDRDNPELPPLPAGGYPWNWGFYAHKSRKYDTTPLEEWQTHLSVAFAAQGIVTNISIGYIGKTEDQFSIRRHDDRDVFFLHEDTQPTPELAETAVSRFIAQRQKGTT